MALCTRNLKALSRKISKIMIYNLHFCLSYLIQIKSKQMLSNKQDKFNHLKLFHFYVLGSKHLVSSFNEFYCIKNFIENLYMTVKVCDKIPFHYL